jgi:hypothetical protein
MPLTISNRAVHYGLDEAERLWLAPASDRSFSWASGGFLSTAKGVARLGTSFRAPVVHRETLDLSFTRQRLASGQARIYGIGWMLTSYETLTDVMPGAEPQQKSELGKLIADLPDTLGIREQRPAATRCCS